MVGGSVSLVVVLRWLCNFIVVNELKLRLLNLVLGLMFLVEGLFSIVVVCRYISFISSLSCLFVVSLCRCWVSVDFDEVVLLVLLIWCWCGWCVSLLNSVGNVLVWVWVFSVVWFKSVVIVRGWLMVSVVLNNFIVLVGFIGVSLLWFMWVRFWLFKCVVMLLGCFYKFYVSDILVNFVVCWWVVNLFRNVFVVE